MASSCHTLSDSGEADVPGFAFLSSFVRAVSSPVPTPPASGITALLCVAISTSMPSRHSWVSTHWVGEAAAPECGVWGVMRWGRIVVMGRGLCQRDFRSRPRLRAPASCVREPSGRGSGWRHRETSCCREALLPKPERFVTFVWYSTCNLEGHGGGCGQDHAPSGTSCGDAYWYGSPKVRGGLKDRDPLPSVRWVFTGLRSRPSCPRVRLLRLSVGVGRTNGVRFGVRLQAPMTR